MSSQSQDPVFTVPRLCLCSPFSVSSQSQDPVFTVPRSCLRSLFSVCCVSSQPLLPVLTVVRSCLLSPFSLFSQCQVFPSGFLFSGDRHSNEALVDHLTCHLVPHIAFHHVAVCLLLQFSFEIACLDCLEKCPQNIGIGRRERASIQAAVALTFGYTV